MTVRPLVWLGRSREDLRSFREDVRRTAGFQLRAVQAGLEPINWKPMPSVGLGVREIRIHGAIEVRVLYLATFPEAVYVLHAFQKRSRKTPRRQIELAGSRLRQLIAWRLSRRV